MDEQVLQNTATVLVMDETTNTSADDVAYVLQGTGLDRDKKCQLKNLAKGITERANLPDLPTNGNFPSWEGWVIGARMENNPIGPMISTAYKIPFREVAMSGISSMNLDPSNPSDTDWVPVTGPSGTRNVKVKFLGGGTKVIYFGTNPNRPEVQTYEIQPEDKELIIYCESKVGNTLPTITGVAPLGLIVRMCGGASWGTTTDALGRINSGVQFPDMDGLIYPVLRGYTCSLMFLGNDEYGWFREIGNSPNVGAVNLPELFLSKIQKLTEIVAGSQSLKDLFPSVSGIQTRVITFFSSVYNNIFHVEKGGVRVDHGYEMARRSSAPPSISDREVSRVYHGDDDKLLWQRGQDASGNSLGTVELSGQVENSWFAHDYDASNVAEGAIWCTPKISHDDGLGNYVNIAPQMSESRGAKVAIFANLTNTPAPNATMVVRVYLQQYFANGGSGSGVPCDITLSADGTSNMIGGSAHTTGNMVIHAGDGIKISQVSILDNPNNIDNSAFSISFGIQTFRAAV